MGRRIHLPRTRRLLPARRRLVPHVGRGQRTRNDGQVRQDVAGGQMHLIIPPHLICFLKLFSWLLGGGVRCVSFFIFLKGAVLGGLFSLPSHSFWGGREEIKHQRHI